MANWKSMIAEEMSEHSDEGPLISSTLSNQESVAEFDAGFGGAGGKAFTAWTEARVYFPVQYDGAEWVGSAPRNPSAEVTNHVGG